MVHTSDEAPAIILHRPQLAENVGMVARAMLNCGISDLRLVMPREDHLTQKALKPASGADDILHAAQVFDSLEAAMADIHTLYATTARSRGHETPKNVIDARHAAAQMRARADQKSAILFGREKSGLTNEDLGLADVLVTIPLNPAFSSLNLAQSVLLMCYEWRQQQQDATPQSQPSQELQLPTKGDWAAFFHTLEAAIEGSGQYTVDGRRQQLFLDLRHMFTRREFSADEVKTLHGVVRALTQS